MADKPATAKYIIDRPVYHTPGKPPHAVGSEQEFPIEDVSHLVDAGFIHRKGSDPAPTAVGVGQQQISQQQAPQTVAPPLPAAPQAYQTKASEAAA